MLNKKTIKNVATRNCDMIWQARSLRDKVNGKVAEIERQEVKVQEEGVQVYGENYSLPSSTREVTMAGKRQGKNLAVTVINEVGSSLWSPSKQESSTVNACQLPR